MPFPIRKNNDFQEDPKIEAQDLSSLIPLLQNPFGLLHHIMYGDQDKKDLKEIWLNSKSKEDKSMVVSASVDDNKLQTLKNKGLIEFDGRDPVVVHLTREGTKLLNETILSDEKTSISFTKKASKDLVSKNSYDFGEEVLVRINHPERYGTKYISIKKSEFKKKANPISIDSYDIKTRDDSGDYRKISDYTDEELVKVLHLSKRIINNHQNIRIAGSQIRNIPIHRIKGFAQSILEELNRR